MHVNADTLRGLLVAFRDDRETLEAIEDALTVFESYHRSIYELEIKRAMYSCGSLEPEAYREWIPRLDRTRSANHNALISQVSLLNRIAAEAGLPPFYDGVVSEDRPYRREVADAVLAWVQGIIEARA